MATEFILPELGENIESADVVDVLVSVGDSVDVDDPILEIETDKASFEVPSTVKGTIKELLVSAGQSARVGQVVMVIEESASGDRRGSQAPSEQPEAATEEAPAAEAQAAGFLSLSLWPRPRSREAPTESSRTG